MAKLTIGNYQFNSQAHAKDYFKALLGRYQNDQWIQGNDLEMVKALAERHPDAAVKIGCGIAGIFKARTEMPGSCFWIHRVDGTVTNFSYTTAVAAKKPSLYQRFAEACRAAVRGDVKRARDEYFRQFSDPYCRAPCQITGKLITMAESHVDHKHPATFSQIVQWYLQVSRIQISEDDLRDNEDGEIGIHFENHAHARLFQEYHNQVADLRVIRADLNCKLGNRAA
jgi:hypothetical protein